MPEKKTAIVTGASGGIGAGLVDAFLKAGYNVAATSRDVSRSLRAGPNLVLVDGDIGKRDTAVRTVEAALQYFGTIDVLVNNAGILRDKAFQNMSVEDFEFTSQVHYMGTVYCTKAAWLV